MHATDRKDAPWTDIEPFFDRALQMDDQSCSTWLGEWRSSSRTSQRPFVLCWSSAPR